jgi:hypothetical protein
VTATATIAVQHGIVEQLGLRDVDVVRPSVERTNLGLYVHRAPNEAMKDAFVEEILRLTPGPAIVYCTAIKAVEEQVAKLPGAVRYHAKLSDKDREGSSAGRSVDHGRSPRPRAGEDDRGGARGGGEAREAEDRGGACAPRPVVISVSDGPTTVHVTDGGGAYGMLTVAAVAR